MASTTLPIIMQPLAIWALDPQLPENVSHQPGDLALTVLGEMLESLDDPFEIAKARYAATVDCTSAVRIVPQHEVVLRHVIRPLKEARQCYVLRMPIACIAQAGLVGEMVALWRFRMLEPKLDGRPLDQELQKLLLGREFDKLGQEERVRVLRAIDTLDEGNRSGVWRIARASAAVLAFHG